MAKISTKIPNFCLNRIRPLVRIRSSPANYSNVDSTTTIDDKDRQEKDCCNNNTVKNNDSSSPAGDGDELGKIIGRRIMIVVDSSNEARHAVQWALTHTVQIQDLITLLHVTKPSKQASKTTREVNPRIPDFLICMKSMCQLKRPEVRVEVVTVQGKEKGPTVLEEAKKQETSLLVLGQKKRSVTWRLMLMWAAGNRAPMGGGGGVAEYCVQNATCMAIAVRKKSKKLGGYLITTKRQKDFWLLA